ncbi:MAG: hypothetical protein NC389_06125 [Acetatifactor muris]|nr:hypothetical protein [Acetatifactor muris]
MMDNLFYYNQGREVPLTAKKPIQGGRMNGKTDINPMWRIKKLTEMFGPCGIGWYYKSVREWIEPYDKMAAAFVKIELFVKVDGEWSMPIQGTGGSMFVDMQKGSPYVSDECFKMATTDAISVACKQLGIGADVYWDKDETKYQTGGTTSNPTARNPPRENAPNGSPHCRSGQSGSAGGRQDNQRQSLIDELDSELSRTGYGWGAVIKKYNKDSPEEMTNLQLKDCISKMKKLPDKVAS